MKKIFKSFYVCLLTVLLISISALSVNAESVYANIESISTMVEIPEEFVVDTANVTPNNTITYSANATTASGKSLLVTSEKTDSSKEIFNFKYLSVQDINNEVENIKNSNTTLCNKNFANVSVASFKEKDNYIVFILYSSDILNNTNISYATAYTVINGELLTVKYVSNNSKLTLDEKAVFNSIVDSINVSQIYVKPQKINFSSVFGSLFTVIIFVIAIISLSVAFYYNSSNRKIYRKESRRLADKYYNELKNEGLMEENQQAFEKETTPSDLEENDKVENKSSDNLTNAINGFVKPSLIDDEWEDIDLEKMFSTSNNSLYEDNQPATRDVEEYDEVDVLLLDKEGEFTYDNAVNESIENRDNSNFVSKAESAKRFAKMYIGNNSTESKENTSFNSNLESSQTTDEISSNDNDNIDPEVLRRVEERQRQRRMKNRKKGKTTFGKKKSNNKTTVKKKSVSKRRKGKNNNEVDPFADFQLDGYWDKYR